MCYTKRQYTSKVVLRLAPLAIFLSFTRLSAFQQPAGPPPLSTELPPLPAIDTSHPTLFLVGDSTMKVGTPGQMGWGEVIGEHFDRARINVVNYARGGRSSRTFQTEGLWDRVLSAVRPGDFVLIQFGHNDGGELFRTTRPRASLPGVAEDTQDGVVELTGRSETVHTFGWYLRKYVSDARARQATPIVCSLVPRDAWKDGKIVRDDRAAWARQVAQSTGAAFLDINAAVARRYEQMGPDAVHAFFPGDHTHTNEAGARFTAQTVVTALKDAQSPLAAFLLR